MITAAMKDKYRKRQKATVVDTRGKVVVYKRSNRERKMARYKRGMSMMTLIAEKKYHEVNLAGLVDPATPYLINISAIGQGDTGIEREGNKVTPTSLQLRLTCQLDTAFTPEDVVRVLVVQWLEDENARPIAAADVLQNIGAPFNVLSTYKQTNKTAFKVLYDKCRIGDASSYSHLKYDVMIPGSKIKPVRFTGSSLAENTLFLIVFSQLGAPAPNQNRISFHSMLRFTDF